MRDADQQQMQHQQHRDRAAVPEPRAERAKQTGFSHAGPNVKTISAWAQGWGEIGGGYYGRGRGKPRCCLEGREELGEQLE